VEGLGEATGVSDGNGDGDGEDVGRFPFHSTQQVRVANDERGAHDTGFVENNCSSVVLHESDMDRQVSPPYLGRRPV
jgi:hypothetical protein